MTIQELFNAAQELTLADQLQLARQIMQSVLQNVQPPHREKVEDLANDPIVGLFLGSPDLASRSTEILAQEISSTSGLSWKA